MISELCDMHVSVIVPSYNREKTIKRCLDSILNQSYPASEIIVVDDGSTDKTLDILNREYLTEVTVIKQEHKGSQAARNLGIQAAKGEYIAFLDSDDEWLPDKLEIQVRELRKNPDAVICGDGIVQQDWKGAIPKIYDATGRRNNRMGRQKLYKLKGKSGYVYKEILKDSFCLFQALLTSRKNLLDIGLLDENVPSYQEWDTAIRLAKQYEFIYIHKPLFIYHLHDDETISKKLSKNIDGLEYICRKFQYEIASQLGNSMLTQRYWEMMKMCIKYRDIRVIKYFVKYILGRMNVFVFK